MVSRHYFTLDRNFEDKMAMFQKNMVPKETDRIMKDGQPFVPDVIDDIYCLQKKEIDGYIEKFTP